MRAGSRFAPVGEATQPKAPPREGKARANSGPALLGLCRLRERRWRRRGRYGTRGAEGRRRRGDGADGPGDRRGAGGAGRRPPRGRVRPARDRRRGAGGADARNARRRGRLRRGDRLLQPRSVGGAGRGGGGPRGGGARAKGQVRARHAITGPRPEGAIGFSVMRGGGLFGEHEVTFAAEAEVLTLSHQALDRGLFANGALAAALWVAGKPPGLYDMMDVLGFRS